MENLLEKASFKKIGCFSVSKWTRDVQIQIFKNIYKDGNYFLYI